MSRLLTYSVMQQRRKVTLGFEPYVAPDDFDRTAQPVDIYEVFCDYYATNQDAKWIYSVKDTTTSLTVVGGTSYHYGYELGGVSYTNDTTTSPIAWTAGSTKRWVITNHTSAVPIGCNLYTVRGIDWLYIGNNVNSVILSTAGSQSLVCDCKYIHIDSLDNITLDIAGHAFWYARWLTGTLHLPSNISSIGGQAFNYCDNLTGDLIIPSNITTIGGSAFVNVLKITGLQLHNNIVSLGISAFSNMAELNGSVTIPTGINTIPNSLFNGCSKLDSVTFHNSITSIGDSAFANCYQLNISLVPPLSLTTIGANAFINCTSLTGTLDIPSGITSIGEGAFGNTGFTSITENNTNYTISDNVLYELSPVIKAIHSVKSNSGSITILSNTEKIGNFCFINNLRTGTLTIPDSVSVIGSYAFYNCNGITSIILETATTVLDRISSYAFSECSGLNNSGILVPNSVRYIDEGAFRNIQIGSLVLGSSLLIIGDRAFQSGNVLGTLIIPNSVTYIGLYAFWGTGITYLILGTGINSINSGAFNTSIYSIVRVDSYKLVAPTALSNIFSSFPVKIELHIPTGSTSYTTDPWTNAGIFAQPPIADL